MQALCEGRFYGLVMACDAVAVYLFFYLADRPRLPRRVYFLVFAAHTCLVLSHILGVVYSSFIVLAMIALDYTKRAPASCFVPHRDRPRSIPDSVPAPPSRLPHTLARRTSGRSSQRQSAFLTDYSGFSTTLGLLIFLSIVLLVMRLKPRRLQSMIATAAGWRSAVYLYTAVIFGLPILFLIEGFFAAPLCTTRYLLPVVVGTMFLIAEVVTLAAAALPEQTRSRSSLWVASWVIFLSILLAYDFFHLPRYNPLQLDYTGTLTSQLPRHVPVVCEDAFAFTELISLQHTSSVTYTFLLDWKNSVAPKAPRLEVTQYHLMENWKNHGYFSGSIVDRDAFLRHTPYFYSISFIDVSRSPFRRPVQTERFPQAGNPLHVELASMPGYHVSLYKVIALEEHTVDVWRICRTNSPKCQ